MNPVLILHSMTTVILTMQHIILIITVHRIDIAVRVKVVDSLGFIPIITLIDRDIILAVILLMMLTLLAVITIFLSSTLKVMPNKIACICYCKMTHVV